MVLAPGFYWYLATAADDMAFREDDWTVVEVWEWNGRLEIQHMGIELAFGVDEHHGKFIGPIDRPDSMAAIDKALDDGWDLDRRDNSGVTK